MNAGGFLEWAVASRPLEGQLETGDLHLVAPTPEGALLAVVDGLGHGQAASQASKKAVAALQAHPAEDLCRMMARCHAALIGTRGAVMCLVSIDVRRAELAWLGVGNVEGILLHVGRKGARSHERLISRGGVVGYQLPTLECERLRLSPGDALVLATDGIHSDFFNRWEALEWADGRSVQGVAEEVLDRYGREGDDALVLVARFKTGAPS